MADVFSTAAYLVELSSDEKEPAQAPPTKQKRTHGSHGSHCHTIEPSPADHWSESDDEFIDTYGSIDVDIAQAASLDDGWPCIIRLVPSAFIATQCSCSTLSTYMHDGQVACSYTSAVSDLFFTNMNITCSCSDHVNHSKECACKHEDDGKMFWILDSDASTHFTSHHSNFVDYVKLKGNDCCRSLRIPTVEQRLSPIF